MPRPSGWPQAGRAERGVSTASGVLDTGFSFFSPFQTKQGQLGGISEHEAWTARAWACHLTPYHFRFDSASPWPA